MPDLLCPRRKHHAPFLQVEENWQKTQEELAIEEDKVNHLNKLKIKLEGTIDDLHSNLEKEKKGKADIEKAKRKVGGPKMLLRVERMLRTRHATAFLEIALPLSSGYWIKQTVRFQIEGDLKSTQEVVHDMERKHDQMQDNIRRHVLYSRLYKPHLFCRKLIKAFANLISFENNVLLTPCVHLQKGSGDREPELFLGGGAVDERAAPEEDQGSAGDFERSQTLCLGPPDRTHAGIFLPEKPEKNAPCLNFPNPDICKQPASDQFHTQLSRRYTKEALPFSFVPPLFPV